MRCSAVAESILDQMPGEARAASPRTKPEAGAGPVSVYIGIGSNIESEPHIKAVVAGIAELGQVTGISGFYGNPPIGGSPQPDYTNGAVRLSTTMSVRDLRKALRALEASRGRRRTEDKHAARTIDLDILLYGEIVDEELHIPDPQIVSRPFVVIPILDIDPDLILPPTGRSLAEVTKSVEHNLNEKRELTLHLRSEHIQ